MPRAERSGVRAKRGFPSNDLLAGAARRTQGVRQLPVSLAWRAAPRQRLEFTGPEPRSARVGVPWNEMLGLCRASNLNLRIINFECIEGGFLSFEKNRRFEWVLAYLGENCRGA